MRAMLIAFALLVSSSVLAGSPTAYERWLDSLPPMPAKEREAFDRAASSAYDQTCNCLIFMIDGGIYEYGLPIDDVLRRILIDGIRGGWIIPLESSRHSF